MIKNGDWITQKEAEKAYKINNRRLLYLVSTGELEDNGKKLQERRIKYIDKKIEYKQNGRIKVQQPVITLEDYEKAPDEVKANFSPDMRLKMEREKLTIAQRLKIEQALVEGKEAIKKELLDEVLKLAYERLKPLKTLTLNLKLNSEQLDELREAWKKSFPSV